MNYHDAFGVPGVVTRMFNNYGPRQNPRYVTGTIITQALTRPEIELGALEPLRDFCFCTDGVRGHLTVAAKGVPGDVYVYGQGSNISMADWADLILRTGVEHGFWPDDRHIVIDEGRLRPGVTDVMALRVGYEKLNRETGWEPKCRGRKASCARSSGTPSTATAGSDASTFRMSTHPIWTENALAELRREFGDAYAGRTVLITGADGFMGSHLTDALVELGADVHAFVRATSSGALNNISHLRNRLKVKFADLTDKTSIDYLVKELRDTVSDKPYVFHLGAQAHVGESWHRPYETVMANTIGTLNLLQSVVDWGLELEKFDTAGTSEEYGNVRENVAHHHDFDDAGGLILHERSPINPKSIYATAKVAADFLTMNYHDAFGVPGVVTRMFNNYGPRQNPRYVTGTIITQALSRPEIYLGALEPLRDFCFCTDGVRGHLTVAAKGVPGDVYVYGQGSNISMADWAELILRTGVERGFWPDDRHIVIDEARLRPGVTDVMALRVGYEKLNRETGWEPQVSWEEGVLQTIQWYAAHRERWIGRVDWLGPVGVQASSAPAP